MSRWSRFCPYELELAEDKLKELSNVSVTSHRIPIGNSQHLYTSMCGDPSNPPLILLHGFCGAGMIFYKILEELTRNYYVYIIDLLGMGRSSRPGYSATTVSGAETFFVESIESFRIALGLDKFILVGHSFGGYISGCYSLKYPQWVQYLLFLSPVGMSEQPPGFDYLMYLEEKN